MIRKHRGLLLVLVVLGLFLTPQVGKEEVVESSYLQTNLLQNPGFEEPYVGGVAQGWSPQHAEFNTNPKPPNCSDYYTAQPKWSPESASATLILDGARSQHIGNQFLEDPPRHRGGLAVAHSAPS